MIRVTYLLETPGDPRAMAEKIAADQSTGTFTDLPGETDALRARHAARVEDVTLLEPLLHPSLPEGAGPVRRARATIAFSPDSIGGDIAALLTAPTTGPLRGARPDRNAGAGFRPDAARFRTHPPAISASKVLAA